MTDLEFTINLSSPKDQLMNVITDYEKYVTYLPDQLKNVEIIERNDYFKTTVICEPQMGKRGLYPTLSTKVSGKQVRIMMDLISYCDGANSLLEIAELIGEPFWEIISIINELKEQGLLYQLRSA